jgi:hypothetical protein
MKVPDSRRAERLFGQSGTGRLTLKRAGGKIEKAVAGDTYEPRDDTCVHAFVRWLAEMATVDAAEDVA